MTIYTAVNLTLVVAELPMLEPGTPETPVLFAAVSPSQIGAAFTGAHLYESIDEGASWQPLVHFNQRAVMANVVGTCPGGVSGRFLDRASVLTVELETDDVTLSSEPAEQVASGRINMMLVGNELIGFQTATLVSGRQYQLTNLWRGRRNTEHWIDRHAEGEPCVLVSAQGPKWIPLGLTAVGVPRQFRAVPAGRAVEDVPTTAILTPTGASNQAWPPYCVQKFVHPSTGDITFTWRRRSHTPFRLLGGVRAPVYGETEERYEIDIVVAANQTIYRTIAPAAGMRTAIYTSAEQTADFGAAAPSPLEIHAYKIHDSLHRGARYDGSI